MTDSPPPSGRPESATTALFVLFRPVLFAVGAIGLTLGALVLLHQWQSRRPAPRRPRSRRNDGRSCPIRRPLPPPVTDADLKSFTAGDFKGFQAGQPPGRPSQQPPRPRSRRRRDRYELTLRLEKGDTIEKMLADIDVPEADRKQIDQALQAILKKRRIAVGEEIELEMQTMPEPARRAARAVAVGAPAARARVHRQAPRRRHLRRRGEDLPRQPAHRAGRRRAARLAAAERHRRGRAVGGDARVHPRAVLRRRLPARAEGRPEVHRAAGAAGHQRRQGHRIPDACSPASSISASAPSR